MVFVFCSTAGMLAWPHSLVGYYGSKNHVAWHALHRDKKLQTVVRGKRERAREEGSKSDEEHDIHHVPQAVEYIQLVGKDPIYISNKWHYLSSACFIDMQVINQHAPDPYQEETRSLLNTSNGSIETQHPKMKQQARKQYQSLFNKNWYQWPKDKTEHLSCTQIGISVYVCVPSYRKSYKTKKINE